jgi:hypothetical protein
VLVFNQQCRLETGTTLRVRRSPDDQLRSGDTKVERSLRDAGEFAKRTVG